MRALDRTYAITRVYADGNEIYEHDGLTADEAVARLREMREREPRTPPFIGIWTPDDPELGYFDPDELEDAVRWERAALLPTLAEAVDALDPDNPDYARDEDDDRGVYETPPPR